MVSLGYTLPSTARFLKGSRFYVYADNLYIFTDYPGNNVDIDQEEGRNMGNDDEAYPVPRTFTFGANFKF